MSGAWERTRDDLERLLDQDESQRMKSLCELERSSPHRARELRELLDADARRPSWLDGGRSALLAPLDADVEDVEPRLATGTTVGTYRIDAEVGRGGSSVVYRAWDDNVGREVALKVLRAEAHSARRLEVERESLVALAHPHIVSLYDVGRLEDGRPYLVTEWIDGASWSEATAPHDLQTNLQRFVTLGEAIAHAHRQLIVHRDLKPANVWVDGDGAVKVLDFGVSSSVQPETQPRHEPLTVAYASPEQRRGAPASTGMDVWALGVLLFELVEGQHPSETDDGWDGAGPPAFQTSARSGREQDLRAIVTAALHSDPIQRTPSVEQLIDDVRAVLTSRPVSARRSGLVRRACLMSRRQPWGVGLAASLLVALVTIAWLSWAHAQEVRANERIAWRAHADAAYATHVLGDVLAMSLTGGNSASSRDALAALEQRVESIKAAPEAEARLRATLAETYERMGQTEPALTHARRVVALVRNTRGLGPQDQESALRRLARLIVVDEPRRAESLRREADALALERGQ